jgi:flagellar basal body rod protein FlgG
LEAQVKSQVDSVSGVNQDEEGVSIMHITKAYQANAKVISTAMNCSIHCSACFRGHERISSTQINDTMLGSLQTNYSQYGRLQMQIASNKKLLQPSDDPIASVALLGLKKEQASLNQYQKNITQVQNQLSQSEVQLESMTTMMLRLQDLTQTAANDSYSDADRAGIAVEIRSLQEGLIDLANAQDETAPISSPAAWWIRRRWSRMPAATTSRAIPMSGR